ncbi:cupin domain-containing protein [Natrononativus amylolyticus]|uniref:cupin domain-containing protein n=1 Tax=Natrononativus amylolyticus TaxID=2963434 RepID=UPI0020CE491E|nr:cupin domain-containing protein [Natrononativus amylolyticus]
MSGLTVHELAMKWDESTGEPLALYGCDEPTVQTGSYVIEPGERVPETGTTSHDGDELSVLLSGELEVVVDGEQHTVGAESLTVIPAGAPHYSENVGDEPVRLVYTILGEL